MRALAVGVVVVAACGRMGFDAQQLDGAATDGVVTPGCVAGETPGPNTTDFGQGVPAFGTIFQDAPAQMDVFESQLRGRPGITPGDIYAAFVMAVSDYRERRVFVQVPTMVNTATCAQATFNIYDDDVAQYAEFTQNCGQLLAVTWVTGTPTVLANVTYDPAVHRWWQLRAHAGTLTFEFSPDGITWTSLATTPTPAYFDDSYLQLASGTYQMESMAVGEVRYDDLFDCFAQ